MISLVEILIIFEFMIMTMKMTMKYYLLPSNIQFMISKLKKEIIHITCMKSINLAKGLEAMAYGPQYQVDWSQYPRGAEQQQNNNKIPI